jgi:heat shock protein HslJ
VLTGIEQTDDETVSMTSVGRVRAHLEIEEESFGFDTGCNSGGGQVRVDGDTLRLGEVVTTLRACTGQRDRVEREVMAVLGEERVTWSISSGQLRLTAGAATLLYDAE